MAYPLIVVALIQLIVGSSVYFRSPKDIERINKTLQIDKTKIQTQEIPRMEVVMKNFTIYKWIEITLILVGLIMYYYFQHAKIWKGFGLGLSIQAVFMLLLDFFAESRGKTYLEYLKTIT
jgi:hypothetical protein